MSNMVWQTAQNVITEPFRARDADTQLLIDKLPFAALLETVKPHEVQGRVSAAEFDVHWPEGVSGGKVTAYETVANFGAMVSTKPPTPWAYATLLAFALAYGRPTMWLADEGVSQEGGSRATSKARLERRAVTAAWVTGVGKDAVSVLKESHADAYRWRAISEEEVLRRARPALLTLGSRQH